MSIADARSSSTLDEFSDADLLMIPSFPGTAIGAEPHRMETQDRAWMRPPRRFVPLEGCCTYRMMLDALRRLEGDDDAGATGLE